MIIIQFSATRGPLSRLIRFFTWSEFSHVDVVLSSDFLLGAQWDGVKVRPPDYQAFSKTVRYTITLNAEVEQEVMAFLYAQLGKPYDKVAIFSFPFRKDWQDDGKWFCSELVAAAFAQAGVPLVHEAKNRITPRDLTLSPLLTLVTTEAPTPSAALRVYCK